MQQETISENRIPFHSTIVSNISSKSRSPADAEWDKETEAEWITDID